MAAIANITIKAANGTTDVVATALIGAAGDGIPARWRVEDASKVAAHRTSFVVVTKPNQKKDARIADVRLKMPVTRLVNGATVLVGTIPMSLMIVAGEQYTQAEIDEAVAQGLNFASHSVIRDVCRFGYSPT